MVRLVLLIIEVKLYVLYNNNKINIYISYMHKDLLRNLFFKFYQLFHMLLFAVVFFSMRNIALYIYEYLL